MVNVYFSALKSSDFISKYFFWIILGIYLVVIVMASGLPVFWDMYGQVKTAHYYLDTSFTNLFPNGNGFSDNGHFPLYNLYLASLFKVFGLKLWVAHISVLPFVGGLLWQLRKLSLRYLEVGPSNMVLLLCLALPSMLNLSIHFSSEIALAFSAVWLINSILQAHVSRIILASSFLCLLNLRGLPVAAMVMLYALLFMKEKNAWWVLIGILIGSGWIFVHYRLTGWFFSNPEIENFRAIKGPGQVWKSMLIGLFRAADQGSLVLWFFAGSAFLIKRLRSQLFAFAFIALLAVMLYTLPISNPVNNRYFLLVNVLLLPAFIKSIWSLLPKGKYVVFTFSFIILFACNWLLYPQKYSNAWDCSLQGISYFETRRQLDEYVAKNKIAPAELEAGFQVYFNDMDYLLNGIDREYALLSDTQMPRAVWVANSNICNNFNPQRDRFLSEHYNEMKTFKKGAVFIKLYRKKDSF